MSWIEEELQRREALEARDGTAGRSRPGDQHGQAESSGIPRLWDRFEAANLALPETLQLRRQARKPGAGPAGMPDFLVWLIAPNGAGLGLTGSGIRYRWPEESRLKSNNFWIHWHPKKGYRLVRRVGPANGAPSMSERRLKDDSVEEMLRCLVTNTRVDYKTVSRGWLGWYF